MQCWHSETTHLALKPNASGTGDHRCHVDSKMSGGAGFLGDDLRLQAEMLRDTQYILPSAL